MKKNVLWLLIATLAFVGGPAMAQSRQQAAEMMQERLLNAKEKQETRQTLDPSIFARQEIVENAYKIAKEVPGALDGLFCYCYCALNPNFKHKSLLTCYVDDHAAKCMVCMREAYIAKKMTEDGKSPREIAEYVKGIYLKEQQDHSGHKH